MRTNRESCISRTISQNKRQIDWLTFLHANLGFDTAEEMALQSLLQVLQNDVGSLLTAQVLDDEQALGAHVSRSFVRAGGAENLGDQLNIRPCILWLLLRFQLVRSLQSIRAKLTS